MSRAQCCSLKRVLVSHARDPSNASRLPRAGMDRTGGPFSRTLLALGLCFESRVVAVGLFLQSFHLGPSLMYVSSPAQSLSQGIIPSYW